MSFKKVLPLPSGNTIPQIGLGTWLSKPGEVKAAVEIAIKHGYRHLDLAMIYQNQREVGQALEKFLPDAKGVFPNPDVKVERRDLFITSKLWNSSHQKGLAEKELDETLRLLGLDYLDLYLIHWPVAFEPGNGLNPKHPTKENQAHLDLKTTLVETWEAMVALKKTGKVRHIGVSNFTIDHIKGITKNGLEMPSVNQVEMHPLLLQDDLVAFCNEQNIHITAYSPLGNNTVGLPKLTENPIIQEIAAKHGPKTTAAQVLIAWGAYRGFSVIPKSVQEDRIKSNFEQIELTKDEFETLSAIGKKKHRFNIPYNFKPSWDIKVFSESEEANATNDVNIGTK
jgi:L-glyceraldehyde reductase